MSDLVYVYAVLLGAPTNLPRGIGGQRLRLIAFEDLRAAVSNVPADEFDEAPLNAGLTDMHWLGPRAVAHQEANQALHERAEATIPLAFGTVFRDDARVCAVLAEGAESFRARLVRMRGRAEWVVAVHRTSAPGPSDALRELHAEIDATSPGRAHLLKRRYAELEREEGRRQQAEAIAHVLEKLRAGSDDVFEEPLPTDTVERPMLRASVLVPRAAEARFIDLVERLTTDWYEVLLTGPWPPYRFGGLEDVARAH